MKGTKKCIGLLILSIICLLSLNLYSNANAAEKIDFKGSRLVQTINYNSVNPQSSFSNVPIRAETLISPVTVTVPQGAVFKISSLTLNLQDSFSVKKDDYFDYYVNVYVLMNNHNANAALNESPFCPTFTNTNDYIIDDCNIVFYNTRTDLLQLLPLDNNTPATYNTNYVVDGYYQLKIKGHFNKDINNFQNLNSFGPLYTVGNTLPVDLNITYSLGFSRVRFYSVISNSSDEAAKKELEDRNNIETQAEQTEEGAGDSSEDIASATTNITGIVSTFLGNLQNLNANQCTLPEITAYGFSLGQLNLCTFQPPSWVQGISSAVVSLIMLGLAVHLFKRIMGIAKRLAGSN